MGFLELAIPKSGACLVQLFLEIQGFLLEFRLNMYNGELMNE